MDWGGAFTLVFNYRTDRVVITQHLLLLVREAVFEMK